MAMRSMYLMIDMHFIAAWQLVTKTCKKTQVHVTTKRCLPRCMQSVLPSACSNCKSGQHSYHAMQERYESGSEGFAGWKLLRNA